MSETTSFQIVLPCFNPRQDWAVHVVDSLEKITALLNGLKPGLIVVNDGSTKGINKEDVDLLKSKWPEFKFVEYEKNRGKGFALRKGMEVADAAILIYTDIDFPYEEESLVNMYKILADKTADVCAGVRDTSYYENVPPGRKRISKFLRWMLRKFLRLEITDTQCGLKGFNTKGKEVFLQTRINRFLFDLEFIFLSSNDSSIRLKPCEVKLKEGIVFSKVSWRILFMESLNFFRVFVKGIWRAIFGKKKKTAE